MEVFFESWNDLPVEIGITHEHHPARDPDQFILVPFDMPGKQNKERDKKMKSHEKERHNSHPCQGAAGTREFLRANLLTK